MPREQNSWKLPKNSTKTMTLKLPKTFGSRALPGLIWGVLAKMPTPPNHEGEGRGGNKV